MTLLVKLQYKNFEPGEFTGQQKCSYEQTIALIESFPWEAQRDHLRVGLTSPSVTIQDEKGNHLKFSLYYNGKFVLYFFDSDKHLFSHSFDKLSTAYPFIHDFFTSPTFNPAGFKKETNWLQRTSIHFVTSEFHYAFTSSTLVKMTVAGLLILFVATVWTLGFFMLTRISPAFWIIPITLWIILARVAALAANHYRYAKNKILILSRGKDEFSINHGFSQKKYYKKDIRQLITYGRRGRNGYPRLTRVEILFADGTSLDISCLLISQELMMSKFPGIQQSTVGKFFPFINRGVSTPF